MIEECKQPGWTRDFLLWLAAREIDRHEMLKPHMDLVDSFGRIPLLNMIRNREGIAIEYEDTVG